MAIAKDEGLGNGITRTPKSPHVDRDHPEPGGHTVGHLCLSAGNPAWFWPVRGGGGLCLAVVAQERGDRDGGCWEAGRAETMLLVAGVMARPMPAPRETSPAASSQ